MEAHAVAIGEDRLWALLDAATVRVYDAHGNLRGSGFFVEPKRVVTAAHVVVEAEKPLSLSLSDGRRCSVVHIIEALPPVGNPAATVWPMPDVAMLSVNDEWLDAAIPFVEMSDLPPTGELLVSGSAMGLVGEVVSDRTRLRFEATRDQSGYDLHKLVGGAIAPGMSGGPVLDPQTGKVVGLVKADRGVDPAGGAFVVAGAAVASALPALWASHLEAHRLNPRWRVEALRTRYADVDPEILRQYLQALVDEYRTSPMLPGDLLRSQVRQPARVRPRRAIGTQIEAHHRDDPEEEAQEVAAHAGEAFLWDPLRSPWRAAAIVAGPGMGKTWLLTHHAVAIAEQSLKRVTESSELHVEVPLPVVVSAPALARRLPPDPSREQVLEALGATLRRALRDAPDDESLLALLALALEDSRVVLCVDGLDEVPDDLRERLRASLVMIEPRVRQLVVSGRESARDTVERVFGPAGHEEFELTGFASGDVRRFIRSWHRDRDAAIRNVERAMGDNLELRTLAQVPLLLSFICGLAETGNRLSSTRSGLYHEVALSVLSGRWRGPDPAITDPVVRLRMLAQAAGPLAQGWRSRPDEFSEHDLDVALRAQPAYETVRDAAMRRWRRAEALIDRAGHEPPQPAVLWEFISDGLLIPTQGPHGEPLLRFSHLVFGELCVAMWLAELPDDEQAEQVEMHRWFDRHWADIIPIACGVAADPSALLKRLDVQDDDPWLIQAQLLASSLVEAQVVEARETAERLVQMLVERLGGPQSDAPAARRALSMLMQGRVAGAEARLVQALRGREIHSDHKGFAMRLLCQVGESYAVAKCKEIVANPDAPPAEREEAAQALCRTSDHTAVELVITAFSTQRGTYEELAIALAGGETASRAALELIRNPNIEVALRVAVAGTQLQVNGVETGVYELLADRSLGLHGRVSLIVALLRANQHVADDEARALLDDPNITKEAQLELVHALLLRGEFRALPAAADMVAEGSLDQRRRRALAQTMVSVGRDGTQALYMSATRRDRRPWSRLVALLTLIERRHADGAGAAAALIADGDGPPWVRAQLLGSMLIHTPQLVDLHAVSRMLSDPELSGSESHVAWEDLASEVVRAGPPELREPLQDRIRLRMRRSDENAEDLADVDTGRLIALLAASGQHGLELLVSIASDLDTSEDDRITAAMAAVIVDVQRAPDLEGLLDEEGLPQAIRDRLAVAFAMLGAPSMLPRILGMLPGSEPAYVALRSILGAETTSRQAVVEGVAVARQAVAGIRRAEPLTWKLDFAALAAEMDFPADSETERQIRVDVIAAKLRARTYARLLSLLLPSERLALSRVGGFVDNAATRNWLATWIPAYGAMAQVEASRVQAEISDGRLVLPKVDPDMIESIGPYEVLQHTSALLEEFWKLLQARRWASCLHFMTVNKEIMSSDLVGALDHIAVGLGNSWPDSTARSFLLNVMRSSEDLRLVHSLFKDTFEALDVAKLNLDAGNANGAYGAASFAVFRAPNDAAGYFYTSTAAGALKHPDVARALMEDSAKRASPQQAVQGRRTLLAYGDRGLLEPSLVDELREILGRALGDGADGLDGDPQESGMGPETETDLRATEGEQSDEDDEQA